MRMPYILLAFANDDTNPMGELPALKEERLAIEDTLRGSFQISSLVPATLLRIEDTFASLGHRIRIFHYAGHAGSDQIELVTGKDSHQGGFAKGMAKYIGLQKGVQLVFLNGCSTEGQVQHFLTENISAVIATTRPVRDKVAKDFAERFYAAFSGGNQNKSLKQAFDEAKASLENRYSENREFYRKIDWEQNEGDDLFPYKLHLKKQEFAKICYKDLILDEPIIDPGPIQKKAYLLCDRVDANEDFKESLENHLKSNIRKPLSCLVEGEDSELPRILCERFYEFSVERTFKKLDEVLSPSRFKRFNIQLPLERDYRKPNKAFDRVRESFKENLQMDDISHLEIRKLDASRIVKHLGQNYRIVIFQHNLYQKDWDIHKSPLFIESYLDDFWNINLDPENPEIILLFSFQYPKRKNLLNIFRKPKVDIVNHFRSEKLRCMSSLPSVLKGDVLRWVDDYSPNDSLFVNELFGKNKKLPMQIVLPALKKILERRNY